MSVKFIEAKQEALNDRGYFCEICGQPNTILDAHHCLWHRMKGKPELDSKYNIQLVCITCHTEHANSYENRQAFYEKQAKRYGKLFYDWYESLSLKVKKY